MGTARWLDREPGLAGGQEHWSCCWDTGVPPSDNPCSGTAGTHSHQGERGHASPADSGSFCSFKSPADAMDKSHSKGGAHYHSNVTAVTVPRKPGSAFSFPFLLELWMLWIMF